MIDWVFIPTPSCKNSVEYQQRIGLFVIKASLRFKQVYGLCIKVRVYVVCDY